MTRTSLLHLLLLIAGLVKGFTCKAGPFQSSSNMPMINSLNRPTQKWDVDRYQSQHKFVYEMASDLIDMADIQPGEHVLDVGCGSGELTNKLAAKGAIALGIDSSEDMIRQAGSQFPNVSFLQADVRNIQVGRDFDVIFSNAALHWIKPEDAECAIMSMASCLKPGGRFVVEFGGRGNVEQILKSTQRAMKELWNKNVPNPWNFPSIPEYGLLLERHGIEVTSAVLFDRPTILDAGESGLSNWLRMFGASIWQGMADKDVDHTLAVINDDLKRKTHLWNGQNWTADYRRLRIVGKKL